MRHKEPTPEQLAEWATWVASRPASLQAVLQRYDPWTLYRLKTTGQRVFLMAFSEPKVGGKVTCRVGVTGEFNLVAFERSVFGVDPDDLQECDLPGPDEPLGTLALPEALIKELMRSGPEAVRRRMPELIATYPIRRYNIETGN